MDRFNGNQVWLRKAGVEPGDTSRAAGRGGGERRACADVGDARSGITLMGRRG